MGVPADIVEDLLRPGKRPFGVDDPLGLPSGRKVAGPRASIVQRVERPLEVQRPRVKRRLEVLQKQPAKEARQDPDREKKSGSAGNPAGAIRREPTPRHDTM